MFITGKKMDLKEYLYQKRMTITQFCEFVEYSRTHLSQVINGSLKPGKKLLKTIEKGTGGQVTAQDLLEEYEKAKKEKESKKLIKPQKLLGEKEGESNG